MATKKTDPKAQKLQAAVQSVNDACTSKVSLAPMKILKLAASGDPQKIVDAAADYTPKGKDKGTGASISRASVSSALDTAREIGAGEATVKALEDLRTASPASNGGPGAKAMSIGDKFRIKVQNRDKAGVPKTPRCGLALRFWPETELDGAELSVHIVDDKTVTITRV